jgi:hypothetical protein
VRPVPDQCFATHAIARPLPKPRALGRGKGLGEVSHDSLNDGLLERARACGKSSHRLWAVDDDPPDLDLSEQREPVDVGEAEGTPDLDLLTKLALRQRGAGALAPGWPGSIGAVEPAATSEPVQLGHVTVRAIGSQIAVVPTGRSVEQTRH